MLAPLCPPARIASPMNDRNHCNRLRQNYVIHDVLGIVERELFEYQGTRLRPRVRAGVPAAASFAVLVKLVEYLTPWAPPRAVSV